MLLGLRHHPIVGGDDEKGEVYAGDAGQHVADEAFVTGDVDESQHPAALEIDIGEAEVDRQAAGLLLRQPVGIDAGERLDQGGLAVIDVSGGGDDHALPASPGASSLI